MGDKSSSSSSTHSAGSLASRVLWWNISFSFGPGLVSHNSDKPTSSTVSQPSLSSPGVSSSLLSSLSPGISIASLPSPSPSVPSSTDPSPMPSNPTDSASHMDPSSVVSSGSSSIDAPPSPSQNSVPTIVNPATTAPPSSAPRDHTSSEHDRTYAYALQGHLTSDPLSSEEPSASASPTGNPSGSSHVAQIVVGSIVGCILLLLVVFIVCFTYRRRRHASSRLNDIPVDRILDTSADRGRPLSDSGDTTNETPFALSPSLPPSAPPQTDRKQSTGPIPTMGIYPNGRDYHVSGPFSMSEGSICQSDATHESWSGLSTPMETPIVL